MSINEHLCNEARQQSVGVKEKPTFDQSTFGSSEKCTNNNSQLYLLVTSRYCSSHDMSINTDNSMETVDRRAVVCILWQF